MNPRAKAAVAPAQGVSVLHRVGNTPLLHLSCVGRDFPHKENTAVKESDVVSIVPSIAGGKGLKPQMNTDEHRFTARRPRMAWPPVILPALSAVEGSGAKDLLFLLAQPASQADSSSPRPSSRGKLLPFGPRRRRGGASRNDTLTAVDKYLSERFWDEERWASVLGCLGELQ